MNCESQAEVDTFWTKLSEGGEEGPCGWVKDKFGVSWQIVPTRLDELIRDPDQEKAQRVMSVMLGMKKIDLAELERAAVRTPPQNGYGLSARGPIPTPGAQALRSADVTRRGAADGSSRQR